MDTITSLRGQLKSAHDTVEQAVADLSPEHLHHRGAGWTIQSIGGIYGHLVTSEDYLVNVMLREDPEAFIFAAGGWYEKTGFDAGSDGLLSEKTSAAARDADFGVLREYAQAVYAETDAWLATLCDTDLDRPIAVPWMGGEMPFGEFLGMVIVGHAYQHGGEICALKGVLGGRGLPY